jgi:hypothetical protein
MGLVQRSSMIIRIGFGFLLLSLSITFCFTQAKSSKWFVLNPEKPYVYLQFDHIGEREPAMPGESTQGLWLRLVNNCRMPLRIGTFDLGTKDGIGLIHEVIPVTPAPISGGVYKTGNQPPKHELKTVNPPSGYSFDLHSVAILKSGENILFSVPLENVSPNWFLRITFVMDIPASTASPTSYVDFNWHNLPKQVRAKMPL